MAIFRSKFFTFRSPDGKDYSIGPAIVLETILRMIDSKIDRKRARQRQDEVSKFTKDLASFDKTADYMEVALLSFQNLTQDDKTDIANSIQEYRKSNLPEELKILALGFAFLNLVGAENFKSVVSNLKEYLNNQQRTGTASTSRPTNDGGS